jgi:curved DNA-binding protein CbpA
LHKKEGSRYLSSATEKRGLLLLYRHRRFGFLPASLALFFWALSCFAASPFEGMSALDILELSATQLSELSPADAGEVISKAFRRLALRLHPDMPGMKQIDEATRLKMTKQVNEAAEKLRKQYGRGSHRSADGSPPGGSRATRTSPFEEFSFADIFEGAQNHGYVMWRQMESERAASVNPNQRFPRNPTDAAYAALMGGGFGDLNFYERFPGMEPAFLEFMRVYLHDLLDTKAPFPLTRERAEKLEGALQRTGNPPDLARALWEYQKARGWIPEHLRCPFDVLAKRLP